MGSSSAIAAYGRFPSAQVIEHNNELYLIDCGEGTQFHLFKYRIKYNKINHIFISHLHGDHFLGLIGFISSLNLQGRKKSLHIYGPRQLSEIITVQLKYSNTVINYDLIFHPLIEGESELLLETKTINVNSFPLNHRIECHGFRFDEKQGKKKIIKEKLPKDIKIREIQQLKEGENIFKPDGTIKYKNTDYTFNSDDLLSFAYCSDTRYDESIVYKIKNVDLLYHEATFLHEMVERAKSTFHSTAKEAGMIAKKADVGMLMIGHYSARYKELDELLIEAKKEFENVILAIEGESVAVTKSK